jgi:4-amino-4-deoxy-L-arabinose transferase-like glycosyltransferase
LFPFLAAVKENTTSQLSARDEAEISQSLYPPSFWLVLTMLLVFSVVLKLPTLYFSHTEADEQVYLSLANRLLTSGSYNLEGTEIISQLSPGIYDHPLFFHPPLFPACLVPFVYWNAERFAVLVSWLGHALCILAVAVIGRRIAFASGLDSERNPMVEWLPVIGVCLDPLLLFLSRKLWIDSLLTGLCAVSIAAFFCARYSPRRSLWLIIGGILFGLAALSKMPALILTPVVVYLVLTPDGPPRSKVKDLCWGFLPALLLAAPWYIAFYHTYGVLIPSWIKPDKWSVEHYPFVQIALERTPAYYFLKLIAIAPVSLLAFGVYAMRRSLWTSRMFLIPSIWFLLCFITISYLGVQGQGFQMRYIALLIPSIYLMLYAFLDRFRHEFVSIGVLLLLVYGGMTGAINLATPDLDEVDSPIEQMGLLRP